MIDVPALKSGMVTRRMFLEIRGVCPREFHWWNRAQA
jgi:hypothetical protein